MKSPKEKIQMLALREAADDPSVGLDEDLEEKGETLTKTLACPKCGYEGQEVEFEG